MKAHIGQETIDGRLFDVYEVDTGKQIAIVKEAVKTQEELAEQVKQKRIQELKELISNKKLLDMDCTAEQLELKTLLGL